MAVLCVSTPLSAATRCDVCPSCSVSGTAATDDQIWYVNAQPSVCFERCYTKGGSLAVGLGGLLQGSGEDTLHLVLESLATVIRGDKEKGAPWEAHISPCVIQLWARHIADPMLAMEAGGVIEALATGPALPNLLVSLFDLWLERTGGCTNAAVLDRSVSIVTSICSSAFIRAEAL